MNEDARGSPKYVHVDEHAGMSDRLVRTGVEIENDAGVNLPIDDGLKIGILAPPR